MKMPINTTKFSKKDLPELSMHCQVVSEILFNNKSVSSFDAQLLRNQLVMLDILIALLEKTEAAQ